MNHRVRTILDTTLNHLRNNCPENITDLVFEEIKKDYYDEYKQELTTKSAQTLNSSMGRYIREYWGLENIGREYEPESDLIKSYTKHA